MNITEKKSLFWDSKPDLVNNAKFIVRRIFEYGDTEDFKWAVKFYGMERIKKYFQDIGQIECFLLNVLSYIYEENRRKNINFYP